MVMRRMQWKRWSLAKQIWRLRKTGNLARRGGIFHAGESGGVLIAPALPCPVRNQVSVDKQTGQRCRLSWPIRDRCVAALVVVPTQQNQQPNDLRHGWRAEAMVSMVALGCGVALLPEVGWKTAQNRCVTA